MSQVNYSPHQNYVAVPKCLEIGRYLARIKFKVDIQYIHNLCTFYYCSNFVHICGLFI